MTLDHFEEIHQAWYLADRALTLAETYPEGIFLLPERAQAINSCSYFILLFAQMEEIINRAYEEYVGIWEEAAFLHRVNQLRGLLSDKDGDQLGLDYETRCEVAHGRLLDNLPVHISEVALRYIAIDQRLASM